MKRILLFVHYNQHRLLAEYVVYLLKKIRPIFNKIIFISNSSLDENQRQILAGLYETLIVRENNGFDFGAWKDAITSEGWESLCGYDELTMMNDSCFGPIFDMQAIYAKMESLNSDFWGITEHPATNSMPKHIQSYFMCFQKKIILSREFQNFWVAVCYENDRDSVIQKYEIKMSVILNDAGFTCSTYVPAEESIDIAFLRPDLCLKHFSPLIKFKSFFSYPFMNRIQYLTETLSDYPFRLAANHFFEHYDPNISLQIINQSFSISTNSNSVKNSTAIKIALHLHISALDHLDDFFAVIDGWGFKFDLFVTSAIAGKENYIKDTIANHISYKALANISFCDKNLPWIITLKKYYCYDITGYFNISHEDFFSRKDTLDLLLTPIEQIIDIFSSTNETGIVIKDIPLNPGENNALPQYSSEGSSMNYLWEKMECKKTLDFNSFSTLIVPCNYAFWYRPSSLRPVAELEIAEYDKYYLLNYMLIYIAWSEGFNYKIAARQKPAPNSFQINLLTENLTRKLKVENDILAAHKTNTEEKYNALLAEHNLLLNSRSWRLTKPLRKIKHSLFSNKITNELKRKIALGKNNFSVGVIVPNYNYARFLKERFESILAQTYPVSTIIVLDDFSKDNSLEIINEYRKKYPSLIKLFKNSANCGNVFTQWRKGFEMLTEDFIWIAEADDSSSPTFLETVIKKMSHDDELAIGYTQSRIIDENGNITGNDYLSYTNTIDTIWKADYIASGKDEIEKRLSVKNTIMNVSAVVLRNKNLLDASKNAADFTQAGDWRFYTDLLKTAGSKILFISNSLNFHRRHKDSVTNTTNTYTHFTEVCKMQDYIFLMTKNIYYYNRALEYREELKKILGLVKDKC